MPTLHLSLLATQPLTWPHTKGEAELWDVVTCFSKRGQGLDIREQSQELKTFLVAFKKLSTHKLPITHTILEVNLEDSAVRPRQCSAAANLKPDKGNPSARRQAESLSLDATAATPTYEQQQAAAAVLSVRDSGLNLLPEDKRDKDPPLCPPNRRAPITTTDTHDEIM
ncbi:unnamed protein product [Merluccius merluccius]